MTPIDLEIKRIEQERDEFLGWAEAELKELGTTRQLAPIHTPLANSTTFPWAISLASALAGAAVMAIAWWLF